jgi:hypothetical protein
VIPLASADCAHLADVVGRPCTEWDIAIARTLLALKHRIELRVETRDAVVHLYPLRPVTIPEEVLVLRQFLEFTDSPVHWHAPKPADVVWGRS